MSKCSPAHFECANDGSNTSPASNSHDALQSENACLREQVKELREAFKRAEDWFDHHILRDEIPGIAEAARYFREKTNV